MTRDWCCRNCKAPWSRVWRKKVGVEWTLDINEAMENSYKPHSTSIHLDSNGLCDKCREVIHAKA